MSLSDRDSPFANSGLMVTLEPEHFGSPHVLAGMHLQRHYEQRAFAAGRGEYSVPDLLGRTIFWPAAVASRRAAVELSARRGRGRSAGLLPPVVERALVEGLPLLDRRWRGKFLAAATLVGPESRGSSPVRFLRDRRNAGQQRRRRALPDRRRGRLCRRHRQRGARRLAGRQVDHPALRAARAPIGISRIEHVDLVVDLRTPSTRATIDSANCRSCHIGTVPRKVSTPASKWQRIPSERSKGSRATGARPCATTCPASEIESKGSILTMDV